MEKRTVMRKRIFLVFIILTFRITGINAQDIITKTDGRDIRAKVTEINDAEVKYRQFSNPSGPVFAISVAEVFMIKYENGSKDIFKKNSATGAIEIRHDASKKKQAQNPAPEPKPELKPELEPQKTETPEDNQPTNQQPETNPTPASVKPEKVITIRPENPQKQAAATPSPETSKSEPEKQKVIVRQEDAQEQTTNPLTKLPESESVIEQTVTTRKTDSAVVKMNYPLSVKSIPSPYYNVQNRIYKWTTSFKETGGKLGFKLSATDFYIESPSGQKFTNNWSANVDVKKNGDGEVNYWVSSSGQWDGGYFHAVWVGKDDSGNNIRIEQKIQLGIKN